MLQLRSASLAEPGHMKRNCPDLRQKIMQKENEIKYNVEKSAKMARFNAWYNVFLTREGNLNQGWFLDSGATCHMCSDKKLFSTIHFSTVGEVTIANGKTIKANGRGEVKIFVNNGRETVKVTLMDVLWVPELDVNLVSVNKLVRNGYVVEFKGNECFLLKDEQRMKIGEFDNKLYKICEDEKCLYIKNVSNDNEVDHCVHEWHRRMAHRNINDVSCLLKSHGLSIKSCECLNDCEMCITGKMARKSFPKKATRTKEILDCIVSDVCGAMPIESLGRKKYFVTFIDVFSKYTEVKFLRNKNDVADNAINYIEKLKTQLGRKPKVFRSDRGGEYMCEKFQSYLRHEGIRFQCTVGYAPEQNGIAERMNRTLVEAARSMIVDSGLSKSFWAEAIDTANYVLNRIDGKRKISPYELMFNVKPKITHFQEFGCDAYTMIPYEKRRKLDDKAKKVKFVGYDESSKGYRLVDENNKICISRDVHFLQTKSSLNKTKPGHEVNENELDVYFRCPYENDEEEYYFDTGRRNSS